MSATANLVGNKVKAMMLQDIILVLAFHLFSIKVKKGWIRSSWPSAQLQEAPTDQHDVIGCPCLREG